MKIGSIYADIAGDSRYGQTLTVDVTDKTATIVIRETSPIGGMDGPGGAHEPNVTYRTQLSDFTAKDLTQEIKYALAYKGDTIKRYGKPTKEFTWRVGDKQWKGLSVAKCQQALDAMKEW